MKASHPVRQVLGAAAGIALLVSVGQLQAAEVTYTLDPAHTYPSFQADHFGGLSNWRGKFTKSSGSAVLDMEKKTGSFNVTIQTASVDFGFGPMNEHAKKAEMFDVEKFPTAEYKGKLTRFTAHGPTEADGELTLHGVTKPVKLKIKSFKCIMNPMLKREVCGIDAYASIDRTDFGIDYGIKMGFKPEVELQIQAEGIKAE